MKKINYVLFLGLILCSCEKKDYLFISSADKSFYDYKVGTYWNYVNTATNEVEKISVTKRDVSSFYYRHIDSNDEYGERIITHFSSSSKIAKYIQTISYRIGSNRVSYEKFINDELKTTDYLFVDKDSAFSLNIQGTGYDSVYLVKSFYNKYNNNITDPIEKLYVNQYWIVRNIGIIKKSIQDSNGITIFELKDCKIIQ